MKKMLLLSIIASTCFIPSVQGSQLEGYQYLSPKPNSVYVSKHSTIIVRFDGVRPHLTNLDEAIQVQGDEGDYSGRAKIASDQHTLIFKPDRPFMAGETVHVSIDPQFRSGHAVESLNYSFQVAPVESPGPVYNEDIKEVLAKPTVSASVVGTATVMSNGVSVPSDYPHVEITVNDNPDEGLVFINNVGGQDFNAMLEHDGSPYWYHRYPDERRDMKVQKNGLVTMLVRKGYPFGQGFIAMDNQFSVVDSFHAVAGCATDEHGLQVLENGHYLLFGLRTLTIDMSKIVNGGKKNAKVQETGIQEFTPDGDLIFHWRAWDNFDPIDMIGFSPDDQPTDNSFRFPHMNSVDIDDDGHIILSSKRLSEVTKIDRQTGEIIWRLGGANNEFTFVNDPLDGFYNQHSVRVLGNGHYTIFDNGCLHNPQVTRALEYEIDTDNMTATLVWSFVETPPTYAFHMGNVQRLPNGNTFINWAVQNLPKAMEVRPDGSKAYELNYVDRYKTYRAFRFPWDGVAKQPYLLVENELNHVVLIFNKFGDKDVAYYNIYADGHSRPTKLIDSSKTTLKRLNDFVNGRRYYFRVTAVNSQGEESDYSNEESTVVNVVKPGDEMVYNGEFSQDKNGWDWLVRGEGQASWDIQDGVCHISISNGGGDEHDIQITQAGMGLIQGRTFDFEFDAWTDNPRTIEAKIAQNGGSYTDYTQVGLTALSRSVKHFRYRFVMQHSSDLDARIVFNTGANTSDVYIDNVSLKLVDLTAVEEQKIQPEECRLLGNYPNPFNTGTTIAFTLDQESRVQLDLFDVRGRRIQSIADDFYESGQHQVQLNLPNLSSGIYFYRMNAGNIKGAVTYSEIKKMILVK